MADLTLKQGDTYPPLRGLASDDDGAIDLTSADFAEIHLKSGVTLISGTVTCHAVDSDGFNWTYNWAAGDTANTGDYTGELEITWDAGSSPPLIQTVPNSGAVSVTIEEDIA